MTTVVTIAGQDYERKLCYICHGSGTKLDATNAEVIGADRSGICPRCKGDGHILTVVLPPEALRIRESETPGYLRGEPQEIGELPDWMLNPADYIDDEE